MGGWMGKVGEKQVSGLRRRPPFLSRAFRLGIPGAVVADSPTGFRRLREVSLWPTSHYPREVGG